MGFRFRKSVKMGPLKMNFSKSGIGGSVGVKGLRVTKLAKGGTQTTLSVPGSGFSYVSTSNQNKQVTKEATDKITEDNIIGSQRTPKLKRKKRRPIIYTLLGIFILLVIIGACSNEKKIESIDIASQNITMDIEEKMSIQYTTSPSDAKIPTLEMKVDEGLHATKDEHQVTITSTTQEGTFQVELTSGKVHSKISITVINKEKKEAQEKAKLEAEVIAQQEAKAKQEAEAIAQQEAQAKAQQEAEAIALQEAQAKAQQEAQDAAQYQQAQESQSQGSQTPIGDQVYIAGSGNGKKYHRNASCSNMNNPILIQLDKALSQGYTACKKCY